MHYFLQPQPAAPAPESPFGGIEETIIQGVQGLKLLIETIGALIIGVGVLIALFYIIKGLIPPQVESYNKIRLVLARYLALALEFQLGADILSTAIAPSWDQIGKLGAIAVIRTALNYFLAQEMKEERQAEKEAANDKTMIPDVHPAQKPTNE
ncbi:DUF1622 domain-containing protein [Rufibacter sp. XAAS-G3-1]|uniref:DUF1622 domain-containing protein n=1 Tax=Rufibacter sp. XAAS-G3-1 TaxID=2729134 RepID=UPI0015E6F5ED|nr:DUF1622 domain-containing protein [Rufibacter sp. XAAS-G3-1]